MKINRLLFVLAIAVTIIETLYYYSLLPTTVAVHFNAAGQADTWGSKDHFFMIMGITFVLMIIVFSGLPMLIRRVPDSLINLPNKGYWLAPKRREETISRLIDQLFFIGALSLLLMDILWYLVLKANLSDKPSLSAEWLWSMIIAFFVIVILWTILLIRSFRKPNE
ncbi:MAG: DUF1648 domain-containing protein [Nitrospirota bacterium]